MAGDHVPRGRRRRRPAMRATSNGAAPEGPPRNVQLPGKVTERQQPTPAVPAALHRRREAAWRLSPVADGCRDPLDALAGQLADPVEWGGYDVITLGLNCSHGDNCTARPKKAI